MKSVLRNYGLGCIKNFVFSFKKFLMNIEVFFFKSSYLYKGVLWKNTT